METRRRAMVLGVVMLAHVVLIQLWIATSAHREIVLERWSAISVRLLPLKVERDRSSGEDKPWREPPRLAPIPVIEPMGHFLPVIRDSEATSTGDATGVPGASGATQGAGEAGVSTETGETGPLRLRPSREAIQGSFANPAVVDPRANSPKPNSMERMAMAIDRDLCLLVDRAPDGSDRKRWGRYTEVVPAITEQTGLKGKAVRVCVG